MAALQIESNFTAYNTYVTLKAYNENSQEMDLDSVELSDESIVKLEYTMVFDTPHGESQLEKQWFIEDSPDHETNYEELKKIWNDLTKAVESKNLTFPDMDILDFSCNFSMSNEFEIEEEELTLEDDNYYSYCYLSHYSNSYFYCCYLWL